MTKEALIEAATEQAWRAWDHFITQQDFYGSLDHILLVKHGFIEGFLRGRHVTEDVSQIILERMMSPDEDAASELYGWFQTENRHCVD